VAPAGGVGGVARFDVLSPQQISWPVVRMAHAKPPLLADTWVNVPLGMLTS
jgi:hypothetical protein